MMLKYCIPFDMNFYSICSLLFYFIAPAIKPPPLTALNMTVIESNPNMAAQEQLLDDGSGNLTLWRVSKSHLEEVNNKYILYSSEMYYALYTYTYGGETKEILYHWLVNIYNSILLKVTPFSISLLRRLLCAYVSVDLWCKYLCNEQRRDHLRAHPRQKMGPSKVGIK